MVEKSEKRPRRVLGPVITLYERAVDSIGQRMARDPVLGPKITAAARTEAAKQALLDTEPTVQAIAALGQDIEARKRE